MDVINPCHLQGTGGRVSRLNCEFRRDRGTVRTSTTQVTPFACNNWMRVAKARVEWPMVRINGAVTTERTTALKP